MIGLGIYSQGLENGKGSKMKQSNAKKKISTNLLNVTEVTETKKIASMLDITSCEKTNQAVRAIHRPKFAKEFDLIQTKVS